MYVFVQVDCDPDDSLTYKIRKPKRGTSSVSNMRWNGLTLTYAFLEKLAEKIENLGLPSFKYTFFLRADEQIKVVCGTYSEVFLKFFDTISQSFNVGWHPHLYRWSDRCQCWVQEFRDKNWMHTILTECYNDLESNGFNVQFSKMGWCFHNNETMRTLSNVGIIADFSAIPGAKSPGRLVGGISLQDIYDWKRTKPQPYYPSESDYQTQGALKTLEVPSTTYTVSGYRILLYTTKLAFESYARGQFSYFPSHRIRVPLFLPNLNTKNVSKICGFLVQQKAKDYVTIYFHAADLLHLSMREILEFFLFQLISVANKNNVEISFFDAPELYSLCRKKEINPRESSH